MNSKIKTWMPWAVIIAAALASILLVNPAQSSVLEAQNFARALIDGFTADCSTTRDASLNRRVSEG